MANNGKNIPIKAAKKIADDYEKDQVIMICWSAKYQRTWVTTYGKTDIDCDQACQAGNWLKKNMLNWPDAECKIEPSRVKNLQKKIKKLQDEMHILRQ